MIKSNLFNPKKQSKPSSSRGLISLADVGLKLQTTSISEVETQGENFAPVLSSGCTDFHTGQGVVCVDDVSQSRMQVDVFGSFQVDVRTTNIAGDVRHHVSLADLVSRSHAKGMDTLTGKSQQLCSGEIKGVNPAIGQDSTNMCNTAASVQVHTRQRVPRRQPLSSNQFMPPLVATPSSFALTVCFSERYIKPSRVGRDGRASSRMCNRFRYKRQIADSRYPSLTTDQAVIAVRPCSVSVFDFSTPSPDDLVKEKQILAYRS